MALSEIQLKSIELLLSGKLQKDTAVELGVNPKTLQRWLKNPEYYAALNNLLIPQATIEKTLKTTEKPQTATKKPITRESARQNELQLLDGLQASLETILENDSNNLRVIDRLLKISQQRVELLGLKIKDYPVLGMLDVLTKEGLLPVQVAEIVGSGMGKMYDDLAIYSRSLNQEE
jgi:hypothetical protein